jgi:hypothetical protein
MLWTDLAPPAFGFGGAFSRPQTKRDGTIGRPHVAGARLIQWVGLLRRRRRGNECHIRLGVIVRLGI